MNAHLETRKIITYSIIDFGKSSIIENKKAKEFSLAYYF